MDEQHSKRTMVVLLILAIAISVAGTWAVLSTAENISPGEQQQAAVEDGSMQGQGYIALRIVRPEGDDKSGE